MARSLGRDAGASLTRDDSACDAGASLTRNGSRTSTVCRSYAAGDVLLRHQRVQLRENLLVLGEPPGFVLAVNQPAVHLYVKDPTGSLNQLTVDAVPLLDRGCQTGSLRQVVSFPAVLDADSHSCAPDFL